MFKLRDHQEDDCSKIDDAWNTHSNICYQLPTGGGKTVVVAHLVNDHCGYTAVIAHRKEIVSQISLALARNGIVHRIIGSTDTVRNCVRRQMQVLGRSFYDPTARVGVISVDTLIARRKDYTILEWCEKVTLWVIDECHHVVRDNKWGTSVGMFPNAKGLGVTATVIRADGKGLGSHAHGVFDTLVQGLSQRELIDRGNLCDYEIAMPLTDDFDLSDLKLTSSGDHSSKQLKARFEGSSKIVGDIVESYLRHAGGKRGITFATDVESAHIIADKYNSLGVPALAISAKTKEGERNNAIDRLQSGELLQLVNVDLFGEGFDCPSISCVSFARKTESLSMYMQQFGRALRTEEGKDKAMIIDHVANVIRHNLPDVERPWSLDAREAGSRAKKNPDLIPLKRCVSCGKPYESSHPFCPYCGVTPEPAGRSTPEEVEGQLELLSPEVLAAMRGKLNKVNRTPEQLKIDMTRAGMAPVVIASAVKNHRARSDTQVKLREIISWYGGVEKSNGMDVTQSQRAFYHRFGIDVMSAQCLGKRDSEELNKKIWYYIDDKVNIG